MPDNAFKVYENRMRRVAARQGLTLSKSRRMDPMALDYGRYTLTEPGGGAREFDDLAAVEEYLTTPRNERSSNIDEGRKS